MGRNKSDDLTFRDIQGYADEELMYELGARFDHWCFIGIKRNCDSDGSDEFLREWDGDDSMCHALCGNLQHYIDVIERTEDEEEEC